MSVRDIGLCGVVVVDWFLKSPMEQLLFISVLENIGNVDLFQQPLCIMWIVWECQVYSQILVLGCLGSSRLPRCGSFD